MAEPRTPNPEPRPFVVVIGGANVDVIATAAGSLLPGVSNPGRVRLTPGGAGRNVAENLARLGTRVALITAVEAGPFADWLIQRTASAGVDVSSVVRVEGRGNSYVAIESGGVLASAVSDMAAAESLDPEMIAGSAGLIRSADAVVVDANVRPEIIHRTAELSARRLCLLPVSVAKARRVADALPQASLIVATGAETEVLTERPARSRREIEEAGRALQARGPADVVITAGQQGMVWIGREITWMQVSPAAVIDPTGAGDAVAAVATYSVLNDLEEPQAARLAAAAGAMTVEVEGAIHVGLTREALHRYADLAESV